MKSMKQQLVVWGSIFVFLSLMTVQSFAQVPNHNNGIDFEGQRSGQQEVVLCHVTPTHGIILEIPIRALSGHLDNEGRLHNDDFLILSDEDRERCIAIGRKTEPPTPTEPTPTEPTPTEPTPTEPTPTEPTPTEPTPTEPTPTEPTPTEPTPTEPTPTEPTPTEPTPTEPTPTEPTPTEPTPTEPTPTEPTPTEPPQCQGDGASDIIEVDTGDVQGLLDAVDEANADPSLTLICLGGGTYDLPSTLALASDIHMIGNDSVIEPEDGFSSRLISATGDEIILEDLTLQDAAITSGGGAIFAGGITLTIDNVNFLNNAATDGGALYIDAATTVNISDSAFNDNGVSFNGGAIFVAPTSKLMVSGSEFISNSADGNGSAIFNDDGDVSITTTLFTRNVSQNDTINSTSLMTINNSCIFGNQSPRPDIVNSDLSGDDIDARMNWWGRPEGAVIGMSHPEFGSISDNVSAADPLTEVPPFCDI